MSKVSGKIRALERRQAAMEENLDKISEHQDHHSRQMLYVRYHAKQNYKYMKNIYKHLMGTDKGRKGIVARVQTLETQTKAIIGVASVVVSAGIIGILKVIF